VPVADPVDPVVPSPALPQPLSANVAASAQASEVN